MAPSSQIMEPPQNPGRFTTDDIEQIGNVLTTYSSKDIDIATKRAQILAANESECEVSERTLQRWRKQQRCAGSNGVAVMQALIPKYANCGNRTPRLPQAVMELARKYIRDNYNTPRNAHALGVYHEYSDACNSQGLVPMSYPRFCKEVREMKSTRARKGKRVKYQESPITGEWNDDASSPVHGERPFEVVHIDHTQSDIQTISGRTQNLLKKPYNSIARDAYTGRTLAAYISYDPPSYRSCMMILRDLVRRHGRLPAIVVVDNGPEFHSGDFTSLCDHYGTDIRYRPPGEPRYGHTIERIFGTINSRILHVLEGNTQVMKEPRQTTKSVNPKNHAAWTLPALARAFELAIFDLMDNEHQDALGMSIRQFSEKRMAETGTRTKRLVRYDQDFMIETCPFADNRTRVVDTLRGIRIGYFFYWCNDFANLAGKHNKVEVKVDPWDARQVFARIDGRWRVCRCTSISGVRRLTQKELAVVVDAWSETAKTRPSSRRSQDRLGEWVKLRDPSNFDARLKDKADEMRLAYDALGMTHVETDAPHDKTTPSEDTPQPIDGGNNESIYQLADDDDYELF